MPKYDLHTHFFTNPHRGKYSLETSSREPWFILDAIKAARLDGIGFGNFGSFGTWKDAYEQFSVRVKKGQLGGRYRVCRELENALVFTDEKKEYKVIKIQEIPTLPKGKGHIVAIGLDKGEKIVGKTNCRGILEQARNKGAVVNADHYSGFAGVGKERLEQYNSLIDCFEGFNANYCHIALAPLLGLNPTKQEAEELAKELGINWIATSDCHNTTDIGNGHIETEGDFDFSSANNLRESIRATLTQRTFKPVCKQSNPLRSVLGHMIIYLYDTQIRNRMDWTNLESC